MPDRTIQRHDKRHGKIDFLRCPRFRDFDVAGGVLINDKAQVLTPEGSVLEGLYAGGNCSGQFYGGVDYPLTVPGLSIGRCMTFGVIAMKSMLGEI